MRNLLTLLIAGVLLSSTGCGGGAPAPDPRDTTSIQAAQFRQQVLDQIAGVREAIRQNARQSQAELLGEAYAADVDPGIPDGHPQAEAMKKIHAEMLSLQQELAGSAPDQDVTSHLDAIEKLAGELPEKGS